MSTDYRDRLYATYVSRFQQQPSAPGAEEVGALGRAYGYFLRDWIPAAKESDVLEVACGRGRFLATLRAAGYTRLRGIDISGEQVALARSLGLDVVQGDALAHLEGAPQAHDLVAAFDFIEHLAKDEVVRFLELARGSLRVGGSLVLQTFNAASPFSGGIRYGDFTHEVGFTPKSLSGLLRTMGYGEIAAREVGPIPYGYSLASSVRFLLWQPIRAAIGVINRIETGAGGDIASRTFLIRAKRVG